MSPSLRGRELLRHATDPLLLNSFLMAVNVVLGSIAGFLYWTIAARNYEPSAIGATGTLASLLPLVATCASLGLGEMLVRHYAGERDQQHMLRRSAFTVVAVSAVLATVWWVVGAGRSPLAEVATGVRSYVLLLAAVTATATGLLTTTTMIASRRPALIIVETLAGASIRIGALLLLRPYGAIGVFLSLTIGTAAATLTGWLLIAVVLRPKRGTAVRLAAEQRTFALFNWGSALISMSPRAVAATLIVWRAGTEAAAWVTVPLMTLPLLTIVPSVLSRSLFAEAANDPSGLPRMLKKAVIVGVALTSIEMLVVLVAAPMFLGLFGAAYAQESSTLLRLLSLAAVVAAPNYVLDVAINVSGFRRGFLLTNLTGAGALVGLLIVLSPSGPAGIGAAWVLGQVCYFAVAFVVWRICSRRTGARALTKTVTDSQRAVPIA